MSRKIYSLYDGVAGMLDGQLMLVNRDGPAIRAFFDALGRADTLPGQHPGDYSLVCLGTIEDNGVIVPESSGPCVVATGVSWVESRQRELSNNGGSGVES